MFRNNLVQRIYLGGTSNSKPGVGNGLEGIFCLEVLSLTILSLLVRRSLDIKLSKLSRS